MSKPFMTALAEAYRAPDLKRLRAEAEPLGYRITDAGYGMVEISCEAWAMLARDLAGAEQTLKTLRLLQMYPCDALVHLRHAVEDAGSQKALAQRLGISTSYVSDLLAGKRKISARILAKLGLRAVVSYVRTGS